MTMQALTMKEITSMNEELVALQRETDAERARLALKAGETHGRVAAVITAERDTEITFGLTYSTPTTHRLRYNF